MPKIDYKTIIAMFIVLVIAAKVGFSPTDVAAKL
jgi:hypothetical protein